MIQQEIWMKFEFLKDVAIADIAFRAEGKTTERLFENCALALTTSMADTAKMAEKARKKIAVEGKDVKELLYSFLEELVYIKDVEGLLFRKFSVKISREKAGLRLLADCAGDTLVNIGRENLRNDVKAITMHMFEVKQENGGWAATVVVDI